MLLLTISIIPVIFLGLYIYKKDTEKEPKSLLLALFVSGLVAAILVIIINVLQALIIPDFYVSDHYTNFGLIKLFILIFLEIALVEEFSKWIMIKTIGYKNKAFDQLYDIIVYSVFVALGFAGLENIFYVLEGGVTIGIYRAIFSVPAHVSFGIFMGYYLGLAKLWEKKSKRKYAFYMILSVLVPTLFHTIYNYCLMIETFWYLIIFLGFVIVIYSTASHEVDKISKDTTPIDN